MNSLYKKVSGIGISEGVVGELNLTNFLEPRQERSKFFQVSS